MQHPVDLLDLSFGTLDLGLKTSGLNFHTIASNVSNAEHLRPDMIIYYTAPINLGLSTLVDLSCALTPTCVSFHKLS